MDVACRSLSSHLFPDWWVGWSSCWGWGSWTTPPPVSPSPPRASAWPSRPAAGRWAPAGRSGPGTPSCPGPAPPGCTRTPGTAAAGLGACRCTGRRWAGWRRRRSTRCPAGTSWWAAARCSAPWPPRTSGAPPGRGPCSASSRWRCRPAGGWWRPGPALGPGRRFSPCPGSGPWRGGRRGTGTRCGRGRSGGGRRRGSSWASARGGKCWGTWCVWRRPQPRWNQLWASSDRASPTRPPFSYEWSEVSSTSLIWKEAEGGRWGSSFKKETGIIGKWQMLETCCASFTFCVFFNEGTKKNTCSQHNLSCSVKNKHKGHRAGSATQVTHSAQTNYSLQTRSLKYLLSGLSLGSEETDTEGYGGTKVANAIR